MSIEFEREKFQGKQVNKKRRTYVQASIVILLGVLVALCFWALHRELHDVLQPDPTLTAILGGIVGVIINNFTTAVSGLFNAGTEETKQDVDTPYNGNSNGNGNGYGNGNGNGNGNSYTPSPQDTNPNPCPDSATTPSPYSPSPKGGPYSPPPQSEDTDNSWMNPGPANTSLYNLGPSGKS